MIVQVIIMMFMALPRIAYAAEAVYISEVAWAGSSLSTADEWIELANSSDADVDLSGWRITGAGTSGRDIVIPSETWIPANGALLVANYGAGNNKAAANVTPDIVTSTVSLSNSKMLIQLFAANDVLIDQAGDGSAPFAGFSDDVKASMVRVDIEPLGDYEAVWITCEQAENMLTEDCGTPGMVDAIQSTSYAVQQSDETELPGGEASSTDAIGSATSSEATTTSTEAIGFTTSTISDTATTSTVSAPHSTGTAPMGTATTTTVTTSTESLLGATTGTDTGEVNTEPFAPTSTVLSEPQSQLPRSAFQHETMVRFLRINEVMAAPEDGKEWVELVNLAADRTILLDGLEIHDAVGRAIKLKGEIRPQKKYKVFELSSSKLNNGGDTVYLQTEGGLVVDTLTYADHEKGMALARDAKQAWQYTVSPTPNGTNIIREEEVQIKHELEVKDWDEKIEAEIITQSSATSSSVAIQGASSTQEITTSAEVIATPETENKKILNKSLQNFLRLNEIMPNPTKGKEWVEIISFATATVSMKELEIHDNANKLMSLNGELAPGEIGVFELSSARLNNGGDTIFLQTKSGELLDKLEYDGSKKGYTFARMQDGAWQESSTPSKGKQNFVGQSEERVGIQEDTNGDLIATNKTSAKVSSAKKLRSSSSKSAKSAAKSSEIISITDFSMLHQDNFGGMRVKLRGTVGTLPRHVSGRGFILLNHDGRGLLVRVPSYKKVPAFGEFLTISGTLKFNTYEHPYLSLTKKDGWKVEKNTNIDPKIRQVSLVTPKAEIAWSLVEVQGEVRDVSGSTVHLVVDDMDVDFKIKPGVAYRASRLNKGDVVKVRGVLDITDDIAIILPRTADEIELVSHAPESFAAASQDEGGIPGWTPFGAAALAVGAVEGLKQIKKKVKKERTQSPAYAK